MSTASPTRLLIVDDEAPQLKALCETLSDNHYSVKGFSSPSAALDALRGEKFDLLLTDLKMPEMDGIELLCKAKEIDPDIAAIMMTGHGTIDTAVEAMKAGALDYILKPFKLRAVISIITRALAMRELRLENQQLQHSLHLRSLELEALNKELEAFAHSVSHDLRAPLRAISRYSHLVMRDHSSSLPAIAIPLLQFIEQSAVKAVQLVEDLLNFSRYSRQPLNSERVNMQEVVESVAAELADDRANRNVDLRITDLPACSGDPSLLRQVWVNLISNAQKFTRKRDRAIIEIGHEQRGAESVYYIRDNGAGFDMQYVDRLFEVFQRGHRASDFEGSGVGLSIVQRIIHRHGGRIWADAKVDEGATFYLTLPTNAALDGAESPYHPGIGIQPLKTAALS